MQNEEIRSAGSGFSWFSAFCIHPSSFRIGMNPFPIALLLAIRLYRWTLSPALVFLFGATARCRFTPSCSEYALEAIEHHGALRGAWLAVRRVGRCHPWGGCGHDPVPEVRGQKSEVRSPKSHAVLAGGH